MSQVVFLDSNLGEQRLILCARLLIQRGEAGARYFETCQSLSIELALPHNSPERGESLRVVLLNQAGQLAALQAKALTEQTKFARRANR